MGVPEVTAHAEAVAQTVHARLPVPEVLPRFAMRA